MKSDDKIQMTPGRAAVREAMREVGVKLTEDQIGSFMHHLRNNGYRLRKMNDAERAAHDELQRQRNE